MQAHRLKKIPTTLQYDPSLVTAGGLVFLKQINFFFGALSGVLLLEVLLPVVSGVLPPTASGIWSLATHVKIEIKIVWVHDHIKVLGFYSFDYQIT
jgi:hypothetical protein